MEPFEATCSGRTVKHAGALLSRRVGELMRSPHDSPAGFGDHRNDAKSVTSVSGRATTRSNIIGVGSGWGRPDLPMR
jgi:hypothetical protein